MIRIEPAFFCIFSRASTLLKTYLPAFLLFLAFDAFDAFGMMDDVGKYPPGRMFMTAFGPAFFFFFFFLFWRSGMMGRSTDLRLSLFLSFCFFWCVMKIPTIVFRFFVFFPSRRNGEFGVLGVGMGKRSCYLYNKASLLLRGQDQRAVGIPPG